MSNALIRFLLVRSNTKSSISLLCTLWDALYHNRVPEDDQHSHARPSKRQPLDPFSLYVALNKHVHQRLAIVKSSFSDLHQTVREEHSLETAPMEAETSDCLQALSERDGR